MKLNWLKASGVLIRSKLYMDNVNILFFSTSDMWCEQTYIVKPANGFLRRLR